jgi:hypothetical protein
MQRTLIRKDEYFIEVALTCVAPGAQESLGEDY